jgi:tetratricopeptide (TPR) repeat protein
LYTVKDSSRQVDVTQPIYIVELGGGHGKFAFLVLQKLSKLLEFLPTNNEHECASGFPFKYILTDFTRNNAEFWKKHPKFQPFIEKGMLDFAVFDAENDSEFTLEMSGQVLSSDVVKNPMIVIANYVFDTLRHDAFRMVNGQLMESLLTVYTEETFEPDLRDPALINRFKQEWEHRDIDLKTEPYYTGVEEDMNCILSDILRKRTVEKASVIVPVGAIRCLRNLQHVCDGRVIVLAGDKAYNHDEEMKGIRNCHIAVHGSFSVMVNFSAMMKWTSSQSYGGFSLCTPHYDGFKVCMMFLGGKQSEFKRTRLTFADTVQSFGPDTFSVLQRSMREETPNPSLKHILALLRLSGHDPDVFYKFKNILISKAGFPHASEKVQRDIWHDVHHVYEYHFPLSSSKDIAFEVARMCMTMRNYSTAIEFFHDSIRDCGAHHVTYYNLGLCYYYNKLMKRALECFNKSVALHPTYKEAREWVTKLLKQKQTASQSIHVVHEHDNEDEQAQEQEQVQVQEDDIAPKSHSQHTTGP